MNTGTCNSADKVQSGIGKFFQVKPKVLENGMVVTTNIPTKPKPNVIIKQIKCLAKNCTATFLNNQGLGSHINTCPFYRSENCCPSSTSASLSTILLNTNKVDACSKSTDPRKRRMAVTVEETQAESTQEEQIIDITEPHTSTK